MDGRGPGGALPGCMSLSSLRRRRSGFTIIEMLVVFIVFGASAAIAVRSVGATLRRDRVGKAAVMLSADLEQAFAIAGRQRSPIRIAIDSTAMTISLVDRANASRIYRKRTLKDGEFSLDFIRSNSWALDVMPSGLATDTLRLSVGIYDGGSPYSRTIRMTRGGLVRIGNQ